MAFSCATDSPPLAVDQAQPRSAGAPRAGLGADERRSQGTASETGAEMTEEERQELPDTWLGVAAVRSGLIALAFALIATAAQSRPQVAAESRQPAGQHQSAPGNTAPSEARPPVVIQVEPTPQEVEAVAEQEAAHRRVLGLEPDAWVALFTLALTVSTGLLWLDTRKSANAALKAANVAERALIELERPYIFVDVSNTKITTTPSGPYDPTTGSVDESIKTTTCSDVTICFYNYGRTPATITRLEYHFLPVPADGICEYIDHREVGGTELPIGSVSAPGHPHSEIGRPFANFSEGEKTGVATCVKSLWLVGFARYVDFFGRNHITGFSYVFDEIGERFVKRGGKKYNYYYVEEASQIPPPTLTESSSLSS